MFLVADTTTAIQAPRGTVPEDGVGRRGDWQSGTLMPINYVPGTACTLSPSPPLNTFVRRVAFDGTRFSYAGYISYRSISARSLVTIYSLVWFRGSARIGNVTVIGTLIYIDMFIPILTTLLVCLEICSLFS